MATRKTFRVADQINLLLKLKFLLELTVNRDYQFSFITNLIPAGSRPWTINYAHNLMRSIDKTQIYNIDQCLFSSRLCHPPIHYVISLSIFVSRLRKTNYLHNKFCENENILKLRFLDHWNTSKKLFFCWYLECLNIWWPQWRFKWSCTMTITST